MFTLCSLKLCDEGVSDLTKGCFNLKSYLEIKKYYWASASLNTGSCFTHVKNLTTLLTGLQNEAEPLTI